MRKLLKKLFVICMAVIMSVGLVACGGNNDNGDGGNSGGGTTDSGNATVIKFWNPITGPDAPYMQKLVTDFNKEYAGKYKVEADSQSEANHYQRITTSFTDGTTADVCLIHKSRVPAFERAEKLRTVDSLITSIGLNSADYVGETWTSCEIDGNMYAIPYDVLPIVLYYNRKLIPAGYTEADILSDNFTVEKMIEMMKLAYVDAPMSSKKVYGMSFNYAYTEPMFISFLNQQGKTIVSASNPTEPTFACTEGYLAAETVRSIPLAVNSAGIKVSSDSGADHLNIFTQGRALFTIDGIWSAPSACVDTAKLDVGVALLPKVTATAERKVSADGHVFACFKNNSQSSEKDEAISAFIKYLIEHSDYWCQGGKVAAREDCINDASYSALEWGYLSGKLSSMVSPVKTYTYNTIASPIGVEVAKLCEGTETNVENAINKASQDAKQLAIAIA